jgi:hypothetical protein
MKEFAYLGERSEIPLDLDRSRFPKKPGQKLPNGTIIIDENVYAEQTDDNGNVVRRQSIVLCLCPQSQQSFATWDRWVTSDSPLATGGYQIVDTCSWGEYHDTIVDALEDFFARGKTHERKDDDWSVRT